MKKLKELINQAKIFCEKQITASDPEFTAWNNSVIRYMEKNYGINSTTAINFKERSYSLGIYTLDTPKSCFIKAFQKDMFTTLKELEILLEEKEDYQTNNDFCEYTKKSINPIINMYIINDMKEIENILNNQITDFKTLKQLHKKIDSKYQSCIKDWNKSMLGWIPNFGFNYEFLGESALIDNLESMLYKLSSYSMNLNNISKEENMIFQPIINNNNTNNNSNQLNIKVNFDEIRQRFKNDSSLLNDEKLDIINKINDLEKIYVSSDLQSDKWEKVKNILKWLLDKGIDVGIAFLPIIYQIFQQ